MLSVLETVEAERCSAIYGVPTMFIAELEHPRFGEFDLSSLRTGMMGASPSDTHRTYRRSRKVISAWGLMIRR